MAGPNVSILQQCHVQPHVANANIVEVAFRIEVNSVKGHICGDGTTHGKRAAFIITVSATPTKVATSKAGSPPRSLAWPRCHFEERRV